MQQTHSQSIVKTYWNTMGNTPRQLIGVYPMGGGGLLEVPYRHFFEVKHLRQKVCFDETMNVLELGCGNGRWILSLAPLVKSYTGVDFCNVALDIAQEDINKLGLKNVELRDQSIVEFKGELPYDVIYFSGVTQYLQDDELKTVLKNLSQYFKETTVLVDRSTVNYKERENISSTHYISIYRTPKELNAIYSEFGFRLIYEKRSYLFLRGSKIWNSFRLFQNSFRLLVHITRPISYYVMLLFSFFADTINPKHFEGGDRSHDFLIFKRSDFCE